MFCSRGIGSCLLVADGRGLGSRPRTALVGLGSGVGVDDGGHVIVEEGDGGGDGDEVELRRSVFLFCCCILRVEKEMSKVSRCKISNGIQILDY